MTPAPYREGDYLLSAGQLATCKGLCSYIRNTGQKPLAIHDFDDDWTPSGDMMREWLVVGGYVEQRDASPDSGEPGGLYLTDKGEALANG